MAINKFLITLLVMVSMSYQATVYAQPQASNLRWILTGDSVHLDRSTRFLANGYTGAAIRHAKKALQRDKSPLTNLIANHNLCIAITREGDEAAAGPYCEMARNLSIPEVYLKQVKEGFYMVKRGAGDGSIELKAVISRNLRVLSGTEELASAI